MAVTYSNFVDMEAFDLVRALKCVMFFVVQVLHALKRLKGSNDKKVKMSAETKSVFDQLTEDAMRLMDNGDYS